MIKYSHHFISFIFTLSIICISCKKVTHSTPDTNASQALLSVKRGSETGIYDRDGRYFILRGVNYNVLGDYWQANPNVATTAIYQEDQLKKMASYGFNCIRLIFTWSAIEPKRGQYDFAYIQKIKKVVEDAQKYGLLILVDLHQDAYSKFIFSTTDDACEFPQKGWDGAPQWAVFTDNESACSVTGSRESSRAVVHAWQNLWDNKDGIRDRMVDLWKVIVQELGNYENVIGYDIINEPSLGYSSLPDQQRKLADYYGKTVQTIRSTEKFNSQTNKMIFFGPAVTFNGEEIPSVVGPEFTQDKNIVFSPHHYFETISNVLTIEQGFTLYDMLAKGYQAPCMIGEWGVFFSSIPDLNKLARFVKQEDLYRMGSTFWQWSQSPGDPHSIPWDGQNYEQTQLNLAEIDIHGNYTGVYNDLFLKYLARTRPIAIWGRNFSYSSDPQTGKFQLTANADSKGVTELWIPDFFGEPKISGNRINVLELQSVSGGYHAKIESQGLYTIHVTF